MSAEPEEKPKIGLSIAHEGRQIQIKVKPGMLLKKVFNAAEKSFGKEPGTLRFYFEGKRLREEESINGAGIEDEDQLDAFLEQQGGSHRTDPSSTSS